MATLDAADAIFLEPLITRILFKGLCRQWHFRRLNQAFSRNAKFLVKFPDHLQCQWPFAVQNLINTVEPPMAGTRSLGVSPA